MTDETAYEQQLNDAIHDYVEIAVKCADDAAHGKPIGHYREVLDCAADKAIEIGVPDPPLKPEVVAEWNAAEMDLITHCEAVEATAFTLRLAQIRNNMLPIDADDDESNSWSVLVHNAARIINEHCAEIFRLTVAIRALAQRSDLTFEDVRQARSNRNLFDHSLPEQEQH